MSDAGDYQISVGLAHSAETAQDRIDRRDLAFAQMKDSFLQLAASSAVLVGHLQDISVVMREFEDADRACR